MVYALAAGIFNIRAGNYSDLPLPEVVDYNFDIKPILSDNCYTCHGPDANKKKSRFTSGY